MKSERFQIKRKLGEGSFAVVIQAYDTQRKCDVAIKCLKDKFESLKFALEDPEIQIFRCLPKHPNIVNLLEVLYLPDEGRLSLVFEYMSWSLFDFIMESPKYAQLTDNDIKFIFYQITNGIAHLHSQGIFHRDIKPENILIDSDTLQVKIADFGCCKGIYDTDDLTEYISTRFYRPPECTILRGYYGKSMDIWAVACVFFEVLTTEPMFPGNNSIDQVELINSVIGSPSPELLDFYFKHDFEDNIDFQEQVGFGIKNYLLMFHSRYGKFERQLVALLGEMLHQDPKLRISAEDVLRSPFFRRLNVTDKYSQFCLRDGEARANELFHKLMVRHGSNRGQTLDVLRNSLSVIRQSLCSFQSDIGKQTLEEKVVRKMAKTKSINQKIEIRKHFRQIGDDILELSKLGAHSDLLNKLIKNESGEAQPRKKRPPGRKAVKRRRKRVGSRKWKDNSIRAKDHGNAPQSGGVGSEARPKYSHFPSITNSNQVSILKTCSDPKSLSNILNISKFELGSSGLISQSNLNSHQKSHHLKKKSTFLNLQNSNYVMNYKDTNPNVKSETVITQFKNGDCPNGHPEFKHTKSIFCQEDEGQRINLELHKITSINKADANNGCFKFGASEKKMDQSESYKPESTFEKIELVSNIFSQAEQTQNDDKIYFSKLFSFNNSEETLQNDDLTQKNKTLPNKPEPPSGKEESGVTKREKESGKGASEEIKLNQNESQVHLKKNKSEETTLETRKSSSKKAGKGTKAKRTRKSKQRLDFKITNSRAKKAVIKPVKKPEGHTRTPLGDLKNQKLLASQSNSKVARKSQASKPKQIRMSQNQRMTEIFMNVINV